jgi:hypothetical protein
VPVRRLAELRVNFESDFASERGHVSPDLSFYNISQVYAVNPLLIYHPEGFSNTWHREYRRALQQRSPAQACSEACAASSLPRHSVCTDGRVRQLECHVEPENGTCLSRRTSDAGTACRGVPTRVGNVRRFASLRGRFLPTLALLVTGAVDQFELESKLAYARRHDLAIATFLVLHQHAVDGVNTHHRLFGGTFDALFDAFDNANVTVVGYAYNAMLVARESQIDERVYAFGGDRRRLLLQLDARRRAVTLLKWFEAAYQETFDTVLVVGANTLIAGAPSLDVLRKSAVAVRPPHRLLDALADRGIVDTVALMRRLAIAGALERRITDVNTFRRAASGHFFRFIGVSDLAQAAPCHSCRHIASSTASFV